VKQYAPAPLERQVQAREVLSLIAQRYATSPFPLYPSAFAAARTTPVTEPKAIEGNGYLVTYGAVGSGTSWQGQIEVWARGTEGKLLNSWTFPRPFETYADAFAFAESEARKWWTSIGSKRGGP
jgi:hypothetical protein